MTSSLDRLDPHMRFRIDEVRDALNRRRRHHYLRRFALFLLAITAPLALFHLLFQPFGWPRIVAVGVFWVALIYGVNRYLRPLRRTITYAGAALYIDQYYPELRNRMTGMVSLGQRGERLSWMEEGFLAEARHTVSRSPLQDGWEIVTPDTRPWLAPVIALVCLILFIQLPGVWQPWPKGPMWNFGGPFTVEPGNQRVRLGDDRVILVRSKHTEKAATLRYRRGGAEWTEVAMSAGDSDEVRYYRLANIRENVEYQVRFGPWKSPEFKLTTWMPPEALAVDVVYHYPDYLDMPPREAPNATQITGLEGSEVAVTLKVNKPLKKAVMAFEKGAFVEFKESANLTWTGSFTIKENDLYHFEFTDKDGEQGVYSPTYDVVALKDEAPVIKIAFPRRDMEVSPLDELNFDFEVKDDFGLTEFGLRYQVTGKNAVLAPFEIEADTPLEGQGSYQLKLEELGLQTGDLITWTVYAKDRKPDREEFEQMGPPYFLEVRPFQRRFQEAISNQGSQGGEQAGSPLQKQKEILIAIWNLRRKLDDITEQEFEQQHATILKSQKDVQEMASQMQSDNELLGQLQTTLADAVNALEAASYADAVNPLSQAAVHAQEAYRLLLKLEPPSSQVQRNNSMASGGGGGGRQPEGMDQLEMERNRNYYEDERRTQEQQQVAKDALDNLKELAQRQQMINNEIANLISELEEEKSEEAQRRLERLREEMKRNLEKLDQMRRDISGMDPQESQQAREQIDQTREQMVQSMEHLDKGELQEARAASSAAEDNMDRLEEELEKKAFGSAEDRIRQIRDELAEMNRMQQQIEDQVSGMQDKKDSPHLSAQDPKQDNKQSLMNDKEALAEKFKDLMENASETTDLTRGNQELLSRKLGDWLRETSKEGLLEDLEETEEMARYGIWEELAEEEKQLGDKLREVTERFELVADHLVSDELEAREKALRNIEELLNQPEAQSQNGGKATMQEFIEQGHREWQERLENAELLMGGAGSAPREINRARGEVERMRRRFRQTGAVPPEETFQQSVVTPLTRTAEQLKMELQQLRKEREFVLQEDQNVPDRYRKQVSEYFERLTQSEDTGGRR